MQPNLVDNQTSSTHQGMRGVGLASNKADPTHTLDQPWQESPFVAGTWALVAGTGAFVTGTGALVTWAGTFSFA